MLDFFFLWLMYGEAFAAYETLKSLTEMKQEVWSFHSSLICKDELSLWRLSHYNWQNSLLERNLFGRIPKKGDAERSGQSGKQEQTAVCWVWKKWQG